MIKVRRLDPPDILKISETPMKSGEKETRDSILFFSDVNNHPLPFRRMGSRGSRTKESFTIYSDKAIRKQLIKMFNGKCAYCESKITTIYSGDIEHFRPKGGYGDDDPLTKPGYYWLASDWENLLFACPFCNQTYTHEIYENNLVVEAVQGKLNQFPLLSESYRLTYLHANIFFTNKSLYNQAFALEESERLLIKPCTDNAEAYFKYDDIGLILPATNLSVFNKNRANSSIKTYALQRISLVQAREEKIIQIKAQIRRVEEAMNNYSNYYSHSHAEKTWFEGILRKEMIILMKYKNPDQEFSGLAKFIIEKYFDSI